MKKLLIIAFIVTVITNANAQSNCSSTILTTTPTINLWDWRQEFYNDCYITGKNNPYQIHSPFYPDNDDNPNLNGFWNAYLTLPDGIQSVDCQPEDGWELITKQFGTSAPSGSISDPYFILYNKYRGVLRAFFCRVNVIELQNGAVITLGFESGSNKTALLSHLYPITEPVENFIHEGIMAAPSKYRNFDEFWWYADFAVAYDPCTCEHLSQLEFEFSTIESGNITLQLNGSGTLSQIVESGPGTSNNVLPNDFHSVIEFGTNLFNAGQKGYNDWHSAETTINGIGEKNPDLLDDLNIELDALKKFTSYIPWVGTAVGLIDFFTGFGKKDKASQQTPMSFESRLRFDGAGTLSFNNPIKTDNTFNPGSYNPSTVVTYDPNAALQVGSSNQVPNYNNVLGVWSILKPIKVECVDYYYNAQASNHEVENKIRQYKLKDEEIKFALNPASKLEVRSIESSLLIRYDVMETNVYNNYITHSGAEPYITFPLGMGSAVINPFPRPVAFSASDADINIPFIDRVKGMNLEIAEALYSDDNSHIALTLRTPLTPLACFNKQSFFLWHSYSNLVNTENLYKIYAKFVVKLKRVDNIGQDVLFVVTYPVVIEASPLNNTTNQLGVEYDNWFGLSNPNFDPAYPVYVSSLASIDPLIAGNNFGAALSSPLYNIKTDITLNGNYTTSQDFYAWNTITIDNGTTFAPNVNYNINAGNQIVWNDAVMSFPDATHVHNYQIQSYPPGCSTNYASLQYTPAEITAFCAAGGAYDQHRNLRIANTHSSKGTASFPNEFAVFPNPNTGIFTIQVPKDINVASIKIKDVTGRVVKNIIGVNADQANKIKIDAPGLSTGIYNLELNGDNQKWQSKFLIYK